jgi:protein-disulfide isomerase
MSVPKSSRLRHGLLVAASLFFMASSAGLVACAATTPPAPPSHAKDTTPKTAPASDMVLAASAPTSEILPVDADDPQRGNATALVTIVEFGNLQCPFSAKAAVTMDRVLEVYGPDQVRLAWKHNPLPFHKAARPAAELTAALMKRRGDDAFWAFQRKAFTGEGMPSQAGLESLTGELAQDRELASLAGFSVKKVDADIALAKRVGVRGTPAFFVNGIFLSGAQPFERFQALIDQELVAAKAELAKGTARDGLYAARVAANRKGIVIPAPGEKRDKPRPSPVDDKTVWAVPIDGSPVQGPADALVTMVAFTDYQCPFSARVQATIAELRRKYGGKLRVVHKNRPLPFHKQAEPAAHLAAEILAKKGNDAFWTASASIFEKHHDLGTETFAAIAAQMGLDKDATLKAIASQKHDARLEKDEALADDLEAGGTPHFFINGRRLSGAQPVDVFTALIDEELAKAEVVVKSGTPAAKVYERIVASGKVVTLPERVEIPAPGANHPSRGPADAPVVIQVWSDFECPFCKRLAPTLEEVEKAFPGKVRLVFRHNPLAMHPNAALAAEAAVEAFKQGGAPAFWKMHDALFADQAKLDRQGLEATAQRLGLDPKRFAKALDDHVNQPAVEADRKIAADKGMTGTPVSFVNGYKLAGAQPPSKLKRLVQKVLDEQKGALPAAKPVAR